MKLKLFLLFTLNCCLILGHSQDSVIIDKSFQKENSFQIELFGHGFLYSLNYERIIFNNPSFKTTGQFGFSYYPTTTGIRELWIPLIISELISIDKHHIECGLGYIFTRDKNEWDGFLTGRIGYRYQKPSGKLIFRVGFTPFVEFRSTSGMGDHFIKEFHPSGGLAIGYSF